MFQDGSWLDPGEDLRRLPPQLKACRSEAELRQGLAIYWWFRHAREFTDTSKGPLMARGVLRDGLRIPFQD